MYPFRDRDAPLEPNEERDFKIKNLTQAQRAALVELDRNYERDASGIPRGDPNTDMRTAILDELRTLGLVKITTWGGLFSPWFFINDAGRKALEDNKGVR